MRVGRDGVIGLILVALSLGLLVQSLSLPQLPLTPIGPGFYPRIVLGLLALAGVALFVQSVTANRAEVPAGGEVQLRPGRLRCFAGLSLGGYYSGGCQQEKISACHPIMIAVSETPGKPLALRSA